MKKGGADCLDDVPDRPIIPPWATKRSQLGKVVDFDGFRWYICRSGDTAGGIAWDFNLDPQKLVFENSSIPGLSRSARLNKFTPLRLGRGKSAFLSKSEAKRLMNRMRADDEESYDEESDYGE